MQANEDASLDKARKTLMEVGLIIGLCLLWRCHSDKCIFPVFSAQTLETINHLDYDEDCKRECREMIKMIMENGVYVYYTHHLCTFDCFGVVAYLRTYAEGSKWLTNAST